MNGGLIQWNAIWNHVNINQPDASIKVVSQACRILESRPCELRCSIGYDDLKIRTNSGCKVVSEFAAKTPSRLVFHARR
jgi:hypothetical protein